MDTITIIKDIVATLSFTIIVDNIVDNSDGTFTINVKEEADCSKHTYHLTGTNQLITLDSKKYKIKSVVPDVSILIKEVTTGAGAPSITTFPVAAPFFRHGTLIEVDSEIGKVKNSNDKFPMIYVLERFTEDFTNAVDNDNLIDRTATVQMFALDISKLKDWLIEDRYNNVIRPMQNLVSELITAFNSSKLIGKFDSFGVTTVPFFGIFNADKGVTEQLFSDICSGAELNIALPIEVDLTCNC